MHDWLMANKNKERIMALQHEREVVVLEAMSNTEQKMVCQQRLVEINREIEQQYFIGMQ